MPLFARRSVTGLLPASVFLAAAFVIPAAVLVRFAAGGSPEALARQLALVWLQPYTRRALANGVGLSFAVSAAAILLCVAPAHLMARSRFPGRGVVRVLLSLPLAFSGVIVGFLAVVMLGRVGFVPSVAVALFHRPVGSGLAYALPGLFLAYLFFEIPRAILSLEAAFVRIDPEIDAAARSLGAPAFQRFRRVTLPMLKPALWATFATTFSVSLGSYGAALVLSRRFSILPVELFQAFTAFGDDRGAAAMAMWLAAISLLVTWTTSRVQARA